MTPGSRRRIDSPFSLLAIPSEDGLFEHVVQELITHVRDEGRSLRASRRYLRRRYPRADLYRQQEVVFRGKSTEIWFAYRDGIGAPRASLRQWWTDRSVARAVIEASGRVRSPNAACRDLLQLPTNEEVRLSDIVSPETCGDLKGAAGWLATTDGLTSSARTQLAWGHAQDIEFHVVWNGAGVDRHTVALRSIDTRNSVDEARAVAASSLRLVSPRSRVDILRRGRRLQLDPGKSIPESIVGEPWSVLVIAGIVRLYAGIDGIQPTLLYAGPGTLLGTHWAPSGDGDVWHTGVEGVTPSTVIQVDPARVKRLMASVPGFARAVLAETQQGLQNLASSLASRVTAPLAQRLAREILILYDLDTERLVPVTEQQLADGVGSLRESVARTIGDFRRRGVLATTRHGVVVLDVAGLRLMATAGGARG